MKTEIKELTLAHMIRFLKNSGGMDNAEISEFIGTSKSLVSFIERGYIPAKEQIKANIILLYQMTKNEQKIQKGIEKNK